MKHKVVAISGSLEENALAGNILKRCALLGEQNLQIEILSIKNLPLLNVDLFQNGFPAKVEELRSKIHHCDALLFAVPEYVGKVSPAFKNAYDWLSYSPTVAYPSPILRKPAVMITLGPGDDGLQLQKHFLQMGQFCKVKIMSKPNLHFSTRQMEVYGKGREIVNPKSVEQLQNFLDYFSEFIGKKLKTP